MSPSKSITHVWFALACRYGFIMLAYLVHVTGAVCIRAGVLTWLNPCWACCAAAYKALNAVYKGHGATMLGSHARGVNEPADIPLDGWTKWPLSRWRRTAVWRVQDLPFQCLPRSNSSGWLRHWFSQADAMGASSVIRKWKRLSTRWITSTFGIISLGW